MTEIILAGRNYLSKITHFCRKFKLMAKFMHFSRELQFFLTNSRFFIAYYEISVKKAQQKIISVKKAQQKSFCQEGQEKIISIKKAQEKIISIKKAQQKIIFSFSFTENISPCRNNFCQIMIFKIVISSSFTILIKSVNFHRICLQNCCQENNFCHHCCYSTENFYP